MSTTSDSPSSCFRDDISSSEQYTFFLLFTLNLALLLFTLSSLLKLRKSHEITPTTLLFHILTLFTISCRLIYESDAFFRFSNSDGLPVNLYILFGVYSAILLNTLLVFAAYFWYNNVVIAHMIGIPPIRERLFKIWASALIIINAGLAVANTFSLTVFWDNGQSQSSNFPLSAVSTSCISLLCGMIFATSVYHLHQHVKRFGTVDKKLQRLVQRTIWIGILGLTRFIVDMNFHFEYLEDFQKESVNNDTVSWPIFIFSYFLLCDILPIFLFLIVLSQPMTPQGADESLLNSEEREERGSSQRALTISLSLGQSNTELRRMSSLTTKILVRSDGTRCDISTLDQVRLICYYFSGNWCPPCREFSPVLKNFYKKLNEKQKNIEIIFVSCDKDEEEFKKSMQDAPWLALDYNDPERVNMLERMEISTVPELVLIKEDGTVVMQECKADVEKYGEKVYQKWVSLVEGAKSGEIKAV